MAWTDERVEQLKKLWSEGLSASQIAKQLGGVTRNAVIGKVHRLGLSGRAAPSRPARRVAKPSRPRTATPAAAAPAARPVARAAAPATANAPAPAPVEPAVLPSGEFATVLTLIVTPAALMVRANFQAWRAKRRQRGVEEEPEREEPARAAE